MGLFDMLRQPPVPACPANCSHRFQIGELGETLCALCGEVAPHGEQGESAGRYGAVVATSRPAQPPRSRPSGLAE